MIEPLPDFREYVNWTNAQRVMRLAEVQWELAATHIQLAYARESEARQKAETWLQSGDLGSIQARDRAAQWASLEAKVVVAELEAKIAARTEEKFLLLRLLDAG